LHSSALAHAGALLVYLDRSDCWRKRCRLVFPDLRLPPGALTISPIDDHDLPDIEALVHKYRDRPMDFVDATLVHLAPRESLATIFTIDHNDFQTSRIDRRKRFRILPAPY
jgi:predicted nucleic acid-binding protein